MPTNAGTVMAENRRILIFTDLDGTLLDHYDYSWEAAQPALRRIFEQNIPLIFCSSKTRQEMIYYRGLIGVEDPFVVENGAAIYVPLGYFPNPVSEQVRGGYEIIELGVPRARLRSFLAEARGRLGLHLRGFADMDVREVQELTALPPHLAEFALQREYDEPFVLLNPEEEARIHELEQLARQKNLRVTRGGRFFHLSGAHDKGDAVRRLTGLYREQYGNEMITVGLGDSPNDLDLLRAVTHPCLVQNARGEYSREILKELRPRLAGGPGPAGWNQVVLELLDELTA